MRHQFTKLIPKFFRFRRNSRGASLPVMLAVTNSALVLIAVLIVLGLGLWSGAQNTRDLLRDKAQIIITTVIDKVRSHLDPLHSQVEFIEQLIAKGDLDPADRPRFVATMTGAIAATPQISALIFIDSNFQALGVARTPNGPAVFTRDYDGDHKVRSAMAAAQKSKQAVWGEPLWRDLPNETVLNLRKAVRRDGKPLGMLVAAVTVRQLSAYLGALNTSVGSSVFILYDRTSVLAHPNLEGGSHGRSKDHPLPTLAETGDPVLAAIWRTEKRYPLILIEGTNLQGHVLHIFNDEYIYIYRNIDGFGSKTWQIGTYFRSADVNAQFRRLMWAALAGLVTLVLAIIAAVIIGRKIARPVVELSAAASRIGQLEISKIAELPATSMFRELNDQSRAFNTMLQGLKWFEIYVPKALVHRLIAQGESGLPASDEREVTVMFTDIAGFTPLSEGMPAPKLAEFLNQHFALLAHCIEEEEGTVDKFIGDSVMAFWGAPDDQSDHARRAARAARAIIAAVEIENKTRHDAGEPPVQLRIGLHSGPVIVGNIGAPGRINYTIIGDTVNIGQRLEQIGKQFYDEAGNDSTVMVIASEATVAHLGPEFEREALGSHRLRGRNDPIEIYRLR